MSEAYLHDNFTAVKALADIAEKRVDDSWFTIELAVRDNARHLAMCRQYHLPYILIDKEYPSSADFIIRGTIYADNHHN